MAAARAPQLARALGMAALLCLGIERSPAARYYASPGGSPAGDGSRHRPGT